MGACVRVCMCVCVYECAHLFVRVWGGGGRGACVCVRLVCV